MILTPAQQKQVHEIVVAAGKNILAKTGSKILASKNLGHTAADIVTETDIETENFLREKLTNLFPDIGFYSEETFKTSEGELEKEYTWVVDPIDGTLNFSRGLPIYCVSVGLMHKMQPIMGVVYFPVLTDLFTSFKGQGAYQNHHKLQVTHRDSLLNAFGSWAAMRISRKAWRRVFDLVESNGMAIGNNYSTVYHLCHIAAGHYDFGMQVNSGLWDIAAGWSLIEEAGGVLEIVHVDEKMKQEKNPYRYWWTAGNPNIQGDLTRVLKKYTNS